MKFTIEPGTSADIDELEKLYDELNDYLAATTNYPGWIKGVYPVREDAVAGVNDETLYVARYDGRIVGSVILNHQPEKAYENVKWKIELNYSHIFVIHTFVVHPSFLKIPVGLSLPPPFAGSAFAELLLSTGQNPVSLHHSFVNMHPFFPDPSGLHYNNPDNFLQILKYNHNFLFSYFPH